jgi:beta-galactosidase GanA
MEKSSKNSLPHGKIYAGEVHFSRIPLEYWEHRMLMIKAMGLNALSIYIMWNFHEIERGKFDFKTENKNLPYFLQLAEKHNLMVLFRPGPYVCAEWDLGGLPARLLSIEGMDMRANNSFFLEETRIYFEALVPIMKKHLRSASNPTGCIVMLQIEN